MLKLEKQMSTVIVKSSWWSDVKIPQNCYKIDHIIQYYNR